MKQTSSNLQEIPSLRSIPGGLEILSDSIIPQTRKVILNAQTMTGAVLGIQKASECLYTEYSSLYRTQKSEVTILLFSRAEHAGFDSIALTQEGLLSLAPKLRSVTNMTTLRVLDSIDGIEPDRFLPLLKKWIDVRLQIFQIMNRNNLEKPIHGFADPELIFRREKELYANNIAARLEEALDPTNPFLDSYADLLDEIEKALWHEMLFYATIVSPDDCIGDSFLPVNYTEGQGEIAYLPGEQSLVHAIYQYRKRYFHQFLIHRKQTGKMQKLMG